MPRKKSLPPTANTLTAVVTALAKENAQLKADLDEVQGDLKDTIDRMLSNARNAQKEQAATKRELQELRHEIEGKTPSQDPQWSINRVRIMKQQLKKMREQVARLERLCQQNNIAIDENGEEQVA